MPRCVSHTEITSRTRYVYTQEELLACLGIDHQKDQRVEMMLEVVGYTQEIYPQAIPGLVISLISKENY